MSGFHYDVKKVMKVRFFVKKFFTREVKAFIENI